MAAANASTPTGPPLNLSRMVNRICAHAALARTPVIAVSANAMPSDLAQALCPGAAVGTVKTHRDAVKMMAGAMGDLTGAVRVDVGPKQARRPLHNRLQLVRTVKFEAVDQPKSLTQRGSQ